MIAIFLTPLTQPGTAVPGFILSRGNAVGLCEFEQIDSAGCFFDQMGEIDARSLS